MDITNYTTEHKKGQHLLSEERHEIEVRLKDGWSIYRIAKHLERPYNTIKNEIKRGTVSLYQGKVERYKADEGKKVYLEHRQNCHKQYRCLAAVRFLQYVVDRFKSADKWSLDASCVEAMRNGTFPRSEMVCTKTLYNYVDKKSGYSKSFLAEHEQEILLHKTAKKVFDEMKLQKLPTIKSLNDKFTELVAEKKNLYHEYTSVRDEMRELLIHKSNVEKILGTDESTTEKKTEHER